MFKDNIKHLISVKFLFVLTGYLKKNFFAKHLMPISHCQWTWITSPYMKTHMKKALFFFFFTWNQHNLLTSDPCGEWTQVCCFVGLVWAIYINPCLHVQDQVGFYVLNEAGAKDGGRWDEKRNRTGWKGNITASSCDCWRGALFLFLPLCLWLTGF